MDSAETEADVFDPLPLPSITQDTPKLKNENASNSSQSIRDVTCGKCFPPHLVEMVELDDILTSRDYNALLAGVCHECLINRLPKKTIPPLPHKKAYGMVLPVYRMCYCSCKNSDTHCYSALCSQFMSRGDFP